MTALSRTLLALPIAALLAGCAETGSDPDDDLALLDGPAPEGIERISQEGKEDGLGALGPAVGCCAETEVWAVRNQWTDRATADARRAGLAWGADSGLSWEEKYRLWVASLRPVPAARGGTTFELTNPWGRTMPAPVLECAEVAYFLRASFASWYALPFFVEARDAQGPLYLGHFGFVRRDGTRYTNSPRFARYADHSARHPHGTVPASWPSDATLRGRGLYGGGDEVPFLGEGARAGAYFDEFYLNKRAGYFMLTLLASFGSVHLADTTITHHVAAEALSAGDVMVERWQRRGIGHTVPVLRVEQVVPGRFQAWVASGSMPRRQPVWEEPQAARRYFTNDLFGGHGTSSDGEPYAALGGGLRRWRIAVSHEGRWRNTVSPASRDVWLNSSDLDSLAARVDRFEELLATVGPGEQRDVLLQIIEAKREHLSRYPASCSARAAREDAFEALYALMQQHFGTERARVDQQYRVLADYVFAELEYQQSRTCCWNSSTAAMYEIVMDYNRARQQDACVEPTVFMMRDGAYEIFRQHARALGREAEWVAWSADESCPQAATVRTDTPSEARWTPFCELSSIVDPGTGPVADACADGNDTRATATPLPPAGVDGRICVEDQDFYAFEVGARSRVTVTAAFRHADGDLELEVSNDAGTVLRSSTSGTDDETIALELGAGRYFARVWGYRGAENSYRLSVAAEALGGGGGAGGDDSPATAPTLTGTVQGEITAGDVDYHRVERGSFTATLTFSHAAGDLDLELVSAGGARLGQSAGTSDVETIAHEGESPVFLKVYGYGNATGAYTLTIR